MGFVSAKKRIFWLTSFLANDAFRLVFEIQMLVFTCYPEHNFAILIFELFSIIVNARVAIVTMECPGLFVLVVVENAFFAEVWRKHNFAVGACFWWLLNCETVEATNLWYFGVHFVFWLLLVSCKKSVVVELLVVTVLASEEIVAIFASYLDSSAIVLAAELV